MTAVADLDAMAEQIWGLRVARPLPVTESFGSDVILFEATDGDRYVIKNSFTPAKGQREIDALNALDANDDVPRLLDHRLVGDGMYLLIEGLDGTPWTSIADSSPVLLVSLGAAVRRVHDVEYGSFDGCDSWHELLRSNADRYHGSIDAREARLVDRGRVALERCLPFVPDSTQPVLVQFDLRPGNILTNGGEFVALIDFESARGGHPSMDFFKLWQQVEPVVPSALSSILEGYRADGRSTGARSTDELSDPAWMDVDRLRQLMGIYSLYHGLAGLAWCSIRDDFSGEFPDVNRNLIRSALAAMEA